MTRRWQEVLMVVVLALAPLVARADDATVTRQSREPGRHRSLGAALGAIGGTIAGLHLGMACHGDDGGGSCSELGALLVMGGVAGVGAVAGYEAAGGLGGRIDRAMDRDRHAIRSGQVRLASGLRLSSLASFAPAEPSPLLPDGETATAESAPLPTVEPARIQPPRRVLGVTVGTIAGLATGFLLAIHCQDCGAVGETAVWAGTAAAAAVAGHALDGGFSSLDE